MGLDEKDKIIVKLIDTTGEDITLALPLWAGVPRSAASERIDRTQHFNSG